MNTKSNKLFSLFGAWLKTQPYSDNTNDTYLRVLGRFLSYLEHFSILNIKDVDNELLVKFITKNDSKKYAQNYINLRQSALSIFYAWTYAHRHCANNPMIDYQKAKLNTKLLPKKLREKTNKTKNETKPIVLTQTEQQALLKTTEGDDFTTARNRCIISLILTGALYAEETISLSITDVDLEKGYIDICSKNRQRMVPIGSEACWLACRNWVKLRVKTLGRRKSSLLFFTDKIRPITKRTLYRIISKHMHEAGIKSKQLGPEMLRQTAIFNMLASGKMTEEVQAITGIKTLKNIQRYCQPMQKD